MDVEDTQSEVSISSGIFNSAYSQQNEVVSPEDLAWIDSCLTEDLNVPESSWIHVENALLEIISSQPQSFNTGIEDTEILPSAVEINQKSSTYHVKHSLEPSSTSDVNPLALAAESSANENLDSEERVTLQSLSLYGNPFRPTYNEDSKENETFDFRINLDSSAYDVEDMSENIFKIWDLDVQSEEGELVKQLEKALSESPLQVVPSSSENSGKWKDFSLDDLIGGMTDLSIDNQVEKKPKTAPENYVKRQRGP
ncbi:uncharacterized protein LOC107630244 isoform X1 [Arachis ipaensis]|nr:uncharacterized protein LOC107630244 isoform X1 [Arachis ipaensis]XP_025643938.1 uncharacterized protein LOC112737968 [Arachis hypogaea]QHO00799.1 uncharacterized protein DS421_13g409480 [Arachis hypogaea]